MSMYICSVGCLKSEKEFLDSWSDCANSISLERTSSRNPNHFISSVITGRIPTEDRGNYSIIGLFSKVYLDF